VQKAICATFAVTTRARAAAATEAPVKAPVEAAPETAPEPASQPGIDHDDVIDLFSDTDSNVSDPPTTMPEDNNP
jgi:hypothetical protein